MVALATIAALPLLMFENPNSTGSLTGTAGAETTEVPSQTSLTTPEREQAADQTLNDGVLRLVNRAENWHSSRIAWI